MKDGNEHNEVSVPDAGADQRPPALQVICLGHSGGPSEEHVTGFLVRSVGSAWAKGSLLAVDAGSHLAPIIRILENDFPLVSEYESAGRHGLNGSSSSREPPTNGAEDVKPVQSKTTLAAGPFAGLSFPHASARANALHVLRNYISTYLITHPHLDHISGFTINTAAFHATSRPKTLAALPSTVDAIKQHIFNDVIWPNLSDEDGGVGFVTFQRLKEGGDVMLGEGEGRGYIDVCDGLGVKAFKVSHGVCTMSPPSHHHRGSLSLESHGPLEGRSLSQTAHYSAPGTPGLAQRASFYQNKQQSPRTAAVDQLAPCVVDSTSYFVRDCDTQREVLIFGDVEPDAISLSPRNRIVWQEAARKIVAGLLGGVFIESSYDDSQADTVLFGHLNPRHLIAELQTLAALVVEAHVQRFVEGTAPTLSASKKRKRSSVHAHGQLAKIAASRRTASVSPGRLAGHEGVSPTDASHEAVGQPVLSAENEVQASSDSVGAAAPLAGLRVVIIHIKDTLKDGPQAADTILAQLRDHEAQLVAEGRGLGCEFIAASSGQSYWF